MAELGKVTKESLPRLRDVIAGDTMALRRWGRVVDRIVSSPADVQRLEELRKDGEHEEEILKSLQIWYSEGDKRADLIEIMREYKLNGLAEKVLEEFGGAFQAGTAASSFLPVWLDVGDVVHNFTGRNPEIAQLHTMLTEGHSTKSSNANVVSICGLGGIGKSTLAKEYAHRHRAFYEGNVIWIHGEKVDGMRDSFMKVAKLVGLELPPTTSYKEVAAAVYEKFDGVSSLFIFDNVEEKADFKQFQHEIIDPDKCTPYVLLTSRVRDLPPLAVNQLCLGVLTASEAVDLIQKQLPETTCEGAGKLAEKLQRLPLTLQQAMAYIRDKHGDDDDAITEYLKEYEKCAVELLNDERFKEDNEYTRTTFTTWLVTMVRILELEDGDSALLLLLGLSYINPDNISKVFISKLMEEKSRSSLRLLQKFSIVIVSSDRVEIHRIVQHVIRLTVLTAVPDLERKVIGLLLMRIGQVLGGETNEPSEMDRLRLQKECSEHGQCLFQFQRSHVEYLKGSTGYVFTLCTTLMSCGNYTGCLSTAEIASAAYEKTYGLDHINTLATKFMTAQVHECLGNFSESMKIYNQIISVCKSMSNLTARLVAVNIESRLLTAETHTSNSEKLIADVYEQFAAPYGESCAALNLTGVILAQKADSHFYSGEYAEAKDLYEKVLETATLGNAVDKYIGRCDVLKKLSVIHCRLKNLQKACALMQEVYEVYKILFGESHSKTVGILKCVEMISKQIPQSNATNESHNS